MKKVSINDIRKLKGSGQPFATVTAYDYTSARIVDNAGIPLILVGDSAAMVVLGYDTTLPVTMDEMLMLTAAVCRGTKRALVIADLPFMSYQASISDALHSAGKFIKKAGASGVKLEGGKRVCPQIRSLVDHGIPVMGHIGLTPQSYHQFSGYTIQGKTVEAARQLLTHAIEVAEAGAFALVLEGIPAEVAKLISEKITIPTIGIGAGPHCDGQIQVFHDILGLFGDFVPKHTKRFANLTDQINAAIKSFISDVQSKEFPAVEHSAHVKPSVVSEIQLEKE